MGHLVRDLGVLLCPFPLGNKSCPVEWTKSLNHLGSIGKAVQSALFCCPLVGGSLVFFVVSFCDQA